jgi:hypothetical protein
MSIRYELDASGQTIVSQMFSSEKTGEDEPDYPRDIEIGVINIIGTIPSQEMICKGGLYYLRSCSLAIS